MKSPKRDRRRERKSLRPDRPVIGWREWVGLPDLGIKAVKAKIDTGARTSALHAYDLEIRNVHSYRMVTFNVRPDQHSHRTVGAEAELVDERPVRSSGGNTERRPVVLMDVKILGRTYTIEVTLTNRDEMGFRMLLGREAVRRRFVVDPGRSFLGGSVRKSGPDNPRKPRD